MSTHVVIVNGGGVPHHGLSRQHYVEYAAMLQRHLGQYQVPSTGGTPESPLDIEIVDTVAAALEKFKVYDGRPRFLVFISNEFTELAHAIAEEYKGRVRVLLLTATVPAGEIIIVPKTALDYRYLGKVFITTT